GRQRPADSALDSERDEAGVECDAAGSEGDALIAPRIRLCTFAACIGCLLIASIKSDNASRFASTNVAGHRPHRARCASSSAAGLKVTRSKNSVTDAIWLSSTRSHSTMGTAPAGVSVTKS